ncbi:MAG: UvrD-helicase domain-containing protein [Chitinispirillaceae bacterium]|nr:UvrD-helicase domain-containing protein [Chitinispirillaceae bacterium]
MPPYTDGLNENQRKAVCHNRGPLLVLAGAGSGKTRVLTMRIARLVKEKKCPPSELLAVTFTNKAAREMKKRVAGLTSVKTADTMTISTFHSLGVKILREDGGAIGLDKSFTIIDEYEKITTLKSIMRATGVRGLKSEDPAEFAVRISLAKNGSIDAQSFKTANPDERKLNRVYTSYSSILLKRHCVDFDDLLLLPLQIFSRFPDILEKYRRRFSYLSIDEFQDTNAVQMKLATLLALPKNNITAVGDDDQGIYSWRGADINNIISFAETFKNCTTVVLDKNYRSTRQILEGAHAVVSRNRVRKIKLITAVAGDGDPIMHYKGDDEEDEAAWIAATITGHHKNTRFRYGDHAILLRTNAMMRRYEEELRRKKVPYKVSGAMSFFERREIKDVFSYLRFFANPHDELSLMRVLKVPHKGISPTTLEQLDDLAALRKMSLWNAFERHPAVEKIGPDQHERIEAFLAFHRRFNERFAAGHLAATTRDLLADTGYTAHLARATKEDDDSQRRKENVEEIIHGIETYEHKHQRKTPTLSGYLQEIALITAEEEEEEKDAGQQNRKVVLMTLHRSKGLEFPVVFLAGLDRDFIPSPRAIEEGKIDEERRLFYVGMTRAQKRLYLTYPGTKVFRGKMRMVTPCTFLNEIPEEFLDGKIGERQDEEKQQYFEDFFKEMKLKFNVPATPVENPGAE